VVVGGGCSTDDAIGGSTEGAVGATGTACIAGTDCVDAAMDAGRSLLGALATGSDRGAGSRGSGGCVVISAIPAGISSSDGATFRAGSRGGDETGAAARVGSAFVSTPRASHQPIAPTAVTRSRTTAATPALDRRPFVVREGSTPFDARGGSLAKV
jgi:hypothetical protein